MNGPPAPDDTKRRVDAKIDAAVEKMNALSAQIEAAAERLAREDAARVRQVFSERDRQAGDDG